MSDGIKRAAEDAEEAYDRRQRQLFESNRDRHQALAQMARDHYRYLDVPSLRLTEAERYRLKAIEKCLDDMFAER